MNITEKNLCENHKPIITDYFVIMINTCTHGITSSSKCHAIFNFPWFTISLLTENLKKTIKDYMYQRDD